MYDFSWIIKHYDDEFYNKEDIRTLCFECLHKLIELSASHGFEGNLWHNYLTYLIVNHENAYSIACELRGEVDGSITTVALHDFEIFKEFFDFDFALLARVLQLDILNTFLTYERIEGSNRIFNKRIRDKICDLSVKLRETKSVEEFCAAVSEFYKEFGTGKFGLHKAFRVESKDFHLDGGEMKAKIVPIDNIAHVKLNDLIGYEIAKTKLIANTEAFVNGKEANNCLLYGDAGTGKSSSIKAVVNQYYAKGLRMIELYKHQFQSLNSVIAQIKNRNYKFIIYMDDLSFEDFETDYKYLKAVIEGGLEKKPDNVLIYATSNRRHLVREKFSDKEERKDDLHTSDTVQEKLSLVARFGVTIYFGAPSPEEFREIVTVLAKRRNIQMKEQELLAEANKWELSHGGLSGRTAEQFINYLLGRQ